MPESANLKQASVSLWIVILCLATMVFGIGDHGLWTPDEPREAEIAREMSLGDSWLIPRLAGEPFVEKPPLYYWLSALLMLTAGKLTGPTTAARMLSALSAALTWLLVWWIAGKYLDRARATAAAVILITTAGFFYAGHRVIIDPLLMFLTCAAILLLFYGLDREKSFLLLLGYLAGGLAFLTKGFVAWGLIALPWLIMTILYFRVVIRKPLLHLCGLLFLLGPGAAWMAAFYSAAGPELWREWFIDNQVGRFLGESDHLGHVRGPLYYLPILPLMLLPWTPVLIGWIAHRRWRGCKNLPPETRNLLLTSFAWSFGNLLLLSLAGTKRDVYLFPLLPGFAVLAAASVGDWRKWEKTTMKSFGAVFLLALLISSFMRLVWVGSKIQPEFGLNLPLLICATISISIFFIYRERVLAQVVGVTTLFYLGVIFAAVPVVDQAKDYEPAVRRIAAAIPPGEEKSVCGWHLDETTRALFPYYTGLTLCDLYDQSDKPASMKRLRKVLDGKDPRFHSVVTYTRKGRNFPPEGVRLKPGHVVVREKMGVNRTVLLISEEQTKGEKP